MADARGARRPSRQRKSSSLRYLAPTYLGETLTAEVEVLSLKPDNPD